MKSNALIGLLLFSIGTGAYALSLVSSGGGVSGQASSAQTTDRIINRVAGIYEGYQPTRKSVRISGKEYGLVPGTNVDFRQFRINQIVVFEVTGESSAGLELITAIQEE